MKKYLLVAFLCLHSCDDSSSSQEQLTPIEETGWSKEEKIKWLYQNHVVPLFDSFEDLNIPTQLHIDEKDLAVNAGAAYGYVEVSRGLVNLDIKAIQLFALAHEVSHIATLAQAEMFGLEGAIPPGNLTNEYKKAEFLADLMSIHLLLKKRPADFKLVKADYEMLQEILNSGRFTHPPGEERIDALKVYIQGARENQADAPYQSRFEAIWNMD